MNLLVIAIVALVSGAPEKALNFYPSYAEPYDAKPGECVPMKPEPLEGSGRLWFSVAKPETKMSFTLRGAGELCLRNQLGQHQQSWKTTSTNETTYEFLAPSAGLYSLNFITAAGSALVPVAANLPVAREIPGGTRDLSVGKGWTTSSRPLAAFENAARQIRIDRPLRVLWLGDSLSDFDRGSNHVNTVAEYLEKTHPGKVTIWNYAKGGDAIRRIIDRMDGKGSTNSVAHYTGLWSRAYDWAVVSLGHNDTKTNLKNGFKEPYTPRAEQHALYDELIKRLRAHGVTRMILLSSTSSDDATCLYWMNQRLPAAQAAGNGLSRFGEASQMEAFNAALKEIAARNHVEFLDVYTEMKNLPYKARLVRGTDGVHLTKRGHDYLALKILQYLAVTTD